VVPRLKLEHARGDGSQAREVVPEVLSRQLWVQLGAIALLAVTVLAVLYPFVVSVAWALILAVVTWPAFRRLERGLGMRTGWAALAMTALVVLVVVGPALLVSLALAREIQQVFAGLPEWIAAWNRAILAWLREIPWIGPQVADWLGELLADPAALRKWVFAQAGPWAGRVAGAVGDLGRNLARAGVALLTLFFLYRNGGALLPQVQGLTRRLAGERVYALLVPVGATVRAVMYGMLLTALAQGALAMLGYWVAGLGAPALLGALTALMAFIPFGAPMVYVPASAWLFLQQRSLAGALLLLWGILVVSTADNVIRSWFISGAVRMPFLLAFFGVLGGLAAFGAIGLFVGPIAMTLLLVLWREWAQAEGREAATPDE